MPARRGLSVARRAAPVAGAQPRFRPQPDGHHLFARLRLCGGRFSGPGNGRLRAGLGLVSAAALVHPDPVRSGGARRAARRFARAVCRPCRVGAGLFRPRGASTAIHRPQTRAGAGDSPRRAATDRHRRRLCHGIWTRAARPRRLRSVRAGAHPLWRVLPAALSRTAGSCRADRRCRQRLIRAEPEHHPEPERLGGVAGGDTLEHARRSAAGAGQARGLRHPRHSGGNRTRCSFRPPGAPAGLCRFRLFPALQPDPPGHPRGDGDRDRRVCCRAMRGPTAACIARRWRKALPWRC